MFQQFRRVSQNIFQYNNYLFKVIIRYESNQHIPIIKIPKYLENNLGNAIYHEHKKTKNISHKKANTVRLEKEHLNKKIISWTGDKQLYYYYGQRFNPTKIPLISKYFLKETYNGHTMVIHNFDENPSLMKNIDLENTFEKLGLNENLTKSIYELVNKGEPIKPSTIQFAAIPSILQYKNAILAAETGSGKTIAYLAPLIQMIQESKKKNLTQSKKLPYALIVLPFREITLQVGAVAKFLSLNTDVGVATMVGGMPYHEEHTGLDLIVTTIGLIDSHTSSGVYSIRNLNHIVLDEADTLLDDSFAYETMELLEKLNINNGQNIKNEDVMNANNQSDFKNGTQLLCVSATMPKSLDSTLGTIINLDEDFDHISTKNLHSLHPNIKHVFYRINRYEKVNKLMEILFECRWKHQPVLIFGNRTNSVNWLYYFLNENNFKCLRLCKNLEEIERHQTVQLFQNGECDILVSTDLGSRGLDTSRVKHVINFDCPHYVADYVHRSGRTGRLGTKFVGQVSTLVSYKPDGYMLMQLETALRLGKPIATVNANIKSQIRQKRLDKRNKIERDLLMKNNSND